MASFGKVDIIHALTDAYGYRRYLEIATPTTGNEFVKVDRARLSVCRLMQMCPPDFSDGMQIDYRVPEHDFAGAVAEIQAAGRRFDVMLIDPFHTYRASWNALQAGFALLAPGGTMVVHDCLPPTRRIANPEFIPGSWCGVTYKAFLDFVLWRDDCRYVTIDTDYGCGVIRKVPREAESQIKWTLARWWRKQALTAWKRAGDDFDAAWRAFVVFRRPLLHLIDAGPFLAGKHGLGASDADLRSSAGSSPGRSQG
jgi:hypothetical protein